MPPLGSPPVHPDIVEEHFDELEWLWEQRDAGIYSADWTLPILAEHEERAEAHLDGLRLSELHGVELARAKISEADAWAAAAATLVLFEAGAPEWRDLILDSFREGEAETVAGIRATLRHCDIRGFPSALEEILKGPDPHRAASAAHVLAFSRRPAPGLEPLLDQEDSGSRILALGAAARLGELYPRSIAGAVESPDPGVRRAGLEAAAHLGVQGLVRHVRAAAARESDPDPEAVYFLGVLGIPEDLVLLRSLLHRPGVAAAAVAAMGAMGRVEGIPLLLDLMEDPGLGPAATAAYKRITGAGNVEGQMPAPSEVPEGGDEPEDLPPDPRKAGADWERRAGSMGSGVSWQMGVPIPDDDLFHDHPELTLEARRDLYLRLRARLGSAAPDLELESLAVRQATRRPGTT
ncbi:MAG: hypothetical protein R6T96_09000 [Longimicrobiales bacterium]